MKGKNDRKAGKARVFVTLKEGVLDPQGQAVQSALLRLGFPEVTNVRIGKVIEISLDAGTVPKRENVEEPVQANERPAQFDQLKKMCERLLANPVIEDFRLEMDDDE